MAKSANPQSVANKKDLSRLLDRKVLQVNNLFTGSKFPTSSSFLKILIGVILAFGVLIFFLNTVDFNRLKSQTLFGQDNPPPPPPDLYAPPLPPEDILNEGNVQGEQISPTTTPTRCYDFNGDGRVTEADVQFVIALYGTYPDAPPDNTGRKYDPKYDLTNDGHIDVSDISMAVSQIGRVCASSTPTPTPSPTPSPCIFYDFDGDGKVTEADVKFVIDRYGSTVGVTGSRYDARYDLNKDGATNILDVRMVVSQIGRVCASPTPTPTPSPTPTPPSVGCAPLRIVWSTVTVSPGGFVSTQVQVNNTSCNGRTVWVFVGNQSNYNNWAYCTISGTGCSTRNRAPSTQGQYVIVAVSDLDQDGKWYEPGEYDKRVLNVLRGPMPLPQ